MQSTSRPRIKVCCISTPEETWTAIRCGASALGLGSAMPSGPGVIDANRMHDIARRVPPGVATFLPTAAVDAVVEQQRRASVSPVQLVDAVCTGVRTDGVLDTDRLRAFAEAAGA